MSDRFTIGDRVQRRVDVYDGTSDLLRGRIVYRYSKQSREYGNYPELYVVHWDNNPNDPVQRGFLPHGLEPDPAMQ